MTRLWSWLHRRTTTEAGGPTVTVHYGHHEATCPECQREKADQEARMRDDQILDVETSDD